MCAFCLLRLITSYNYLAPNPYDYRFFDDVFLSPFTICAGGSRFVRIMGSGRGNVSKRPTKRAAVTTHTDLDGSQAPWEDGSQLPDTEPDSGTTIYFTILKVDYSIVYLEVSYQHYLSGFVHCLYINGFVELLEAVCLGNNHGESVPAGRSPPPPQIHALSFRGCTLDAILWWGVAHLFKRLFTRSSAPSSMLDRMYHCESGKTVCAYLQQASRHTAVVEVRPCGMLFLQGYVGLYDLDGPEFSVCLGKTNCRFFFFAVNVYRVVHMSPQILFCSGMCRLPP